jgi:hypothetical protein
MEQQYEILKRDDHREGYSNVVMVNQAQFDFRLNFGITRQKTSPEQPNTIDVFETIFVSPQHAKALAILLAQNVAQYESVFGPITGAVLSDEKQLTTVQ